MKEINIQLDRQFELVKDVIFNNDIIVPTEQDILQYSNSYIYNLIPTLDSCTQFGLGVRSVGWLQGIVKFFPDISKVELIEVYEIYKRGEFDFSKVEGKTAERIIRSVWDKYNKFLKKKKYADKVKKGYIYIASQFDSPGSNFYYNKDGKVLELYMKIGFTQNIDERFDRLDDGHNSCSLYHKSLLVLEDDRSLEKNILEEFKKDRIINPEGYKKGRYKGEYIRGTDRIFDFIEKNKHRDCTPELKLCAENLNKKMSDIIDRETKEAIERDNIPSEFFIEDFKKEVKEKHIQDIISHKDLFYEDRQVKV